MLVIEQEAFDKSVSNSSYSILGNFQHTINIIHNRNYDIQKYGQYNKNDGIRFIDYL